jgi:hypothetical protein
MAARKPAPQTAAEKQARAALRQSTQLAVDQTAARVRTVSRGAFGQRSLRAGGAGQLAGYEINYKGDPFPTPGTYTTPAPSTQNRTRNLTTTPRPRPKAKPKPKAKPQTKKKYVPVPPPSTRPRPRVE